MVREILKSLLFFRLEGSHIGLGWVRVCLDISGERQIKSWDECHT